MEWYIINIEFDSKKYDEQGTLTYKTLAESRGHAMEKVNQYIEREKKKDNAYNYRLSLLIDISSLAQI